MWVIDVVILSCIILLTLGLTFRVIDKLEGR